VRWFIPNGGTLLLVIALIATAQVWARPLASPTGAPGPSATTVNYQGRLSDSDGVPLDGTYGMSFALYDAATDGNLVWGPEEHTAVEVSDGLFSVGLGSKTSGGIPTTTWNGDRYLEIAVGGETLEPRELIRSVPIAGMALTVPDGAITNEKLSLSYWQARPDTSDTVVQSTDGDSPTEIVSLDVDLATDGVYLIFAKVISQAEDGEQVVAEIWDENGLLPPARAFNTSSQTGGDGRETSTIVTIRPFSAGTHTIKLVAYMGVGEEGKIKGYTELNVIPLGQQ
jgi:hypothetical protein